MNVLLKLIISCGIAGMLIIPQVAAQTYQVGHVAMSFTDPARNNRQIPVEVYYPAVAAGEEVPVAPGLFPG